MFKEFKDNMVNVIVSSHGNTILEYDGVLVSEDDKTIVLKNVSINCAMPSFQKSVFSGGMINYKNNINTVAINKNYIISCNKIGY